MMWTNPTRLPCPDPCLSAMCPRHNPYARTPETKRKQSEAMKVVAANRKRDAQGKFLGESP